MPDLAILAVNFYYMYFLCRYAIFIKAFILAKVTLNGCLPEKLKL